MSSLLLSDRQKTELEEAILDYLVGQGERFALTIDNFKSEAAIVTEKETGKGVLEKKWTTIIRLQKKVMELETTVETLKKSAGRAPVQGDGSTTPSIDGSFSLIAPSRIFPKGPARNHLSGHRAPVSAVACHPVYSIFASASEDNTIRIWDLESAQFERSLKGHTGFVTGLSFDPKGKYLASSSVDLSAKIWDMNTFMCIKTLRGHDHTLGELKFSPTGDNLFTCSRDEVMSDVCLT